MLIGKFYSDNGMPWTTRTFVQLVARCRIEKRSDWLLDKNYRAFR